MKLLLILVVICSVGAYSADIKNGKFEVKFNDRVEAFDGCISYTEGDVVGIANTKDNEFYFAYEMAVPRGTDPLADTLTVTKDLGAFSARGFCGTQNILSGLKMTLKKTLNSVQISYKYRCNRKDIVKTMSCTKV